MQDLDWHDLEIILATGRHGGLVGAAEALEIHHSTAFRRLARAEERVGRPLFARHDGVYAPTELGEIAIDHAARAEEERLALVAELEGLEAAPRGRVRLTTVPSLVEVITPGLGRLAATCPELEIALDATPLARDLTLREADLALRPTTDPPASLWGRRLAGIDWADYAAAGLDPSGLPRIRYDAPRLEAVDGMEGSRCESLAAPWLSVTTVEAMIATVEAGLGVGRLPLYVGDRRPRLFRVGAPFASANGLWILVPTELRKSTRVRAVRERLIEALLPELRSFEA